MNTTFHPLTRSLAVSLSLIATTLSVLADKSVDKGGGKHTPPVPDAIEFGAPRFFAFERHTNAMIVLRRMAPTSNDVSVTFATTSGSAVAGSDYITESIVVPFTNGQHRAVVLVSLIDDSITESNKTIGLALSAPTGGASLGPQSTSSLVILDDDRPGNVQFKFPLYQVAETGGVATITVVRSGGLSNVAKVVYSTSDGTAVAGQDYTATTGTLTFAAGETVQSFTVPILTDSVSERIETVNLKLTSADGVTRVVGKRTARLFIVDGSAAGPGKGHGKIGKGKGSDDDTDADEADEEDEVDDDTGN